MTFQQHKPHGLIDVIVQSVRDKSIDIRHAFSKDFAIEHGYDENNRQEFIDQLRDSWFNSLPYISSVETEDALETFGVFPIEDGTPYNGAEVACLVMKNIFADFLITGEMFLQHNLTNILIPNILFNPDDMWKAKTDFLYQTAGNEVIQFSASSKLIDENSDAHAENPKTDLMQLFEIMYPWQINEDDDNPSTATPLGIYGFMASLIYAMFVDAARRKIFKLYWNEEDLGNLEELTTRPVNLSYDDLPINLHIPYEEVNEVYFATALDALQTALREKDERYKKAPEYTIRKMLEIELRQREHLNDSPLWRGFPDKVQQMLRIYLDEHITFLCEKCGIDASTPQQQLIQDNQPFRFFHYEVTAPDEKLRIHEMVCNIVHQPQMNLVCNSLHELIKDKKILSKIDPQKMLMELRRLGLPDENTKGFSDKNFYSFFNA